MTDSTLNAMARLGGQYAAMGAYATSDEDDPILFDADPDCDHVVVDGDHMSGVKCSNCRGWYCA